MACAGIPFRKHQVLRFIHQSQINTPRSLATPDVLHNQGRPLGLFMFVPKNGIPAQRFYLIVGVFPTGKDFCHF